VPWHLAKGFVWYVKWRNFHVSRNVCHLQFTIYQLPTSGPKNFCCVTFSLAGNLRYTKYACCCAHSIHHTPYTYIWIVRRFLSFMHWLITFAPPFSLLNRKIITFHILQTIKWAEEVGGENFCHINKLAGHERRWLLSATQTHIDRSAGT